MGTRRRGRKRRPMNQGCGLGSVTGVQHRVMECRWKGGGPGPALTGIEAEEEESQERGEEEAGVHAGERGSPRREPREVLLDEVPTGSPSLRQ